jgi:hypothetical protein
MEERVVLASALSALSDRLDAKFFTAYWLPAFVAFFGSFGVFMIITGPADVEARIYELNSVEQALAVLLVILLVSMFAFVLRAVSRPLIAVFAGDALPRAVAAWSTQGHLRVKHELIARDGVEGKLLGKTASPQQTAQWLQREFPLDDAETRPTRLGNVLATAAEHPRLAYAMEGLVWWPRLSPVVPVEFQDQLGGAQAPMMALLNLSLVFAALALVGAPLLILADGHGVAAIVILLVGLILSRLCYRAAVNQARELASLLGVAFDLYRHEILRQMDLDVPTDLATERTLWRQLTLQLLGVPDDTPSPKAASEPAMHDDTE